MPEHPILEPLRLAPKGPRIEIGVHAGQALEIICHHDDVTLGVDSFEGMPEPTDEDYHGGRCNYPKGRLSVPLAKVEALIQGRATLIKGFVPEVLDQVPDGPYAFAHLDIDHYATTKAAMEWLWPRMMPGGVLVADDWLPSQDCLAAKALVEWTKQHPISGERGRKCWWIAK